MLIAPRVSKGGKPIQIRAEVLRDWEPSGLFEAGRGIPIMPDDALSPKEEGPALEGTYPCPERMIAAAKEASLKSYRVETAPDGTNSIVVGPKLPKD